MDSYRNVGDVLLEIYRASRVVPVNEFKQWVYDFLQEIIQFDSGIWLGGSSGKRMTLHSQFLYNQPAEMMENYEDTLNQDDFLRHAVLSSPGRTVNVYDLISREQLVCMPAYDHIKKYGMEQVLSTCVLDDVGGLFNFISFYREDYENHFTREDLKLKEFLVPHLVEAANNNLFHHWRQKTSLCFQDQHAAIADERGMLRDAQSEFLSLLVSEWKEWEGPLLPRQLVNFVAAGKQGRYHGKIINFDISHLGDLFYIEAFKRTLLDDLTHREKQIAQVLAKGCTYKEVAREMGLSPSTVTNHANSIYRKLGIKNKVELSRKLDSSKT